MLKYRKVHLPGHAEYDPARKVQHLEKRYFEVGDLGFPVVRAPLGGLPVNAGLLICNDRRWPEAWRVLGLQSVELVMLGYNTPSLNQDAKGFEAHHLRVLHSHLTIQAGAYQNATFAVATAKAGVEDGCELFGNSIIVNPQGEIMAEATSWGDELITADCDLDQCTLGRTTIFAFDKHRRPEAYGRIIGPGGRGRAAGVACGPRRGVACRPCPMVSTNATPCSGPSSRPSCCVALPAGERLNASIDWPNVIEEILDSGRSELHGCEGLLQQALVHLLKLHGALGHHASKHWRMELLAFLAGARRRYTPSMDQRIDLQSLYIGALRQAEALLADASTRPAWPTGCPYHAG